VAAGAAGAARGGAQGPAAWASAHQTVVLAVAVGAGVTLALSW
jgi:hypothetical protein